MLMPLPPATPPPRIICHLLLANAAAPATPPSRTFLSPHCKQPPKFLHVLRFFPSLLGLLGEVRGGRVRTHGAHSRPHPMLPQLLITIHPPAIDLSLFWSVAPCPPPTHPPTTQQPLCKHRHLLQHSTGTRTGHCSLYVSQEHQKGQKRVPQSSLAVKVVVRVGAAGAGLPGTLAPSHRALRLLLLVLLPPPPPPPCLPKLLQPPPCPSHPAASLTAPPAARPGRR